MQVDGSNEELNMDLSANEQAVLDEQAKGATDAAAAKVATDQAALDAASKTAVAQSSTDDLTRAALEKTTAALETTSRIAAEALARENASTAAADAAAKAAADAATAEANKEPDWAAMKAALREKNEAGDIDDDEFEAQREALLDQRAEWKGANAARREHARLRADDDTKTQASHQLAQERLWQSSWGKFEADESNAVILQDQVRTRAFNAELQAVGQTNPEWSYDQMLAEARANVVKAFNIQQTTADKAAAEQKAELARRATEAGRGPPNLNNLPNSGADLSGGKYAHLDNLDCDSLENALANMKQQDVADYLASSPGSDTRGQVD